MRAVCYFCDSEIEITPNEIVVGVSSDHPYIDVTVMAKCPECGETEDHIVTLEDFFQERGVGE